MVTTNIVETDAMGQQDKVAKRLGSELCEAASDGDIETIQEVCTPPSLQPLFLTSSPCPASLPKAARHGPQCRALGLFAMVSGRRDTECVLSEILGRGCARPVS